MAMMTNEHAQSKHGILNRIKGTLKDSPLFSIGIALVIMIILQTLVLGFDYPSFGSWLESWTNNWINILRNNAGLGIIALGMTLVIMSEGIDLSVGSSLVATGALVMVLIDTSSSGLLGMIGLSGIPAFIIGI